MYVCIIYRSNCLGVNVLPKTGGRIVRGNCPGGCPGGIVLHSPNGKASKIFDNRPLDSIVFCNYIDCNTIIKIFKRDTSLLTLTPSPMSSYVPIGITPSPSRGDVLNGCSLLYSI